MNYNNNYYSLLLGQLGTLLKKIISDKIPLPIAKAKNSQSFLYERMGYKLISRPIDFPFQNWPFHKFCLTDKKAILTTFLDVFRHV